MTSAPDFAALNPDGDPTNELATTPGTANHAR